MTGQLPRGPCTPRERSQRRGSISEAIIKDDSVVSLNDVLHKAGANASLAFLLATAEAPCTDSWVAVDDELLPYLAFLVLASASNGVSQASNAGGYVDLLEAEGCQVPSQQTIRGFGAILKSPFSSMPRSKNPWTIGSRCSLG